MERLTKICEDGTHRAADNLPCGENSWEYKALLLERLGAYEDTGLEPEEVKKLNFSVCYFDELYELCNRVYTEKPEVKNFNEYVKSLILKDLKQNYNN